MKREGNYPIPGSIAYVESWITHVTLRRSPKHLLCVVDTKDCSVQLGPLTSKRISEFDLIDKLYTTSSSTESLRQSFLDADEPSPENGAQTTTFESPVATAASSRSRRQPGTHTDAQVFRMIQRVEDEERYNGGNPHSHPDDPYSLEIIELLRRSRPQGG
jgi:hypothetical protein